MVPGLNGPMSDGVAPVHGPYLNDSLYLEKMQAYANWTAHDQRVHGWLPWSSPPFQGLHPPSQYTNQMPRHWESFPEPAGTPITGALTPSLWYCDPNSYVLNPPLSYTL